MKLFFKINSYVNIAICILIILFFMYDILNFCIEKDTYYRVYNIGSENIYWRYQSGVNYIILQIIYVSILMAFLLLNIFYLKKNNKKILILIAFIEVAFLILIIRYYIRWASIGFDVPTDLFLI